MNFGVSHQPKNFEDNWYTQKLYQNHRQKRQLDPKPKKRNESLLTYIASEDKSSANFGEPVAI